MNEALKIVISAEIDNLKQNINNAKKQVKSFKEQVADAKKNVDADFKAAGASIKTGLKVGAGAIAAAGAALLALSANTAEYRNNIGKLSTAFETVGGSAKQATDTYNDLYRVLGDGGKATEASAHLAQLTTNQKELNQWTNICQGVYATFGDSLPIESLTEAANETAKVGTVTGTLADALNWAGISEDEFNEKLAACNTEAEREKLIRQTLNKTYDEASKKYEKNNAEVLAQNEAQAKLDATMATLGETIAPIMTVLTELANDVLTALTPYIQDFAENYLPTIKDVLGEVGDKLETALNWMKEHKAILAVMAGIIGGIVVAIGLYNAVAAIKAAMDAAQVTTLGALIVAQLAHAAAVIVAIAPYLLIVAAIAAVIAIIVLCIKHWDKIKAAIAKAWDAIKKKTEEAVEKVKAKFENMKKSASEKVENMKAAVVNKFNEIKQKIADKIQAAKDAVTEKFSKVKEAITKPVEEAKEKVSNLIEKIKGFFNFEWSLPKLKIPTVSIKGKFSLSPPSVPKFSISWNKLGGVFDKPTLFSYGDSLQGIGEDGAEAVVPLEKNTQWLDKLADKLAAKQGKTPIVLQVDGKTFAEISVDTINDLTRARGSLPLKLI